MHDNDPLTLETEKQRNLNRQQHKTSTPHHEHAPGWNEPLATASEASVKADRSASRPEEMQNKTVDYILSRHNPDDRAQSTQSTLLKDAVEGPLSSAEGHEEAETLVKKTVHEETTEVIKKNPTPSEESVKADRGEI
ncbi:hypothetical protein VNI00_005021 [Paramarasmius palmivorus]|uniref:Uncharacterized protein n=1 Tax=Paramarasmius palmivorus TaxID=297713 RepID=A0AAW0DHI9_9AGAR